MRKFAKISEEDLEKMILSQESMKDYFESCKIIFWKTYFRTYYGSLEMFDKKDN
jgi:hypothetical protein